MAFLDTNVILRHVLADHPDHSARASEFVRRIQDGELRAEISDTVVFEAVYLLERTYRVPKAAVREVILPLIELPGIVFSGKRRFQRAFELYVDRNLPIADALHAAITETLEPPEIISFGRHFDRIATLTRIEP